MLEDFAIFILSHGRPDSVVTYNVFRRCGYTGKIYIIIDNEDKEAEKYYKNYGDQVIMFDKAAVAETFDEGDNFQDRRSITCARNISYKIARDLGLKYFTMFDDDYTNWCYRMDNNLQYIDSNTKASVISGDKVFGYLLDYYKSCNFVILAMAQGGDYIGGRENDIVTSLGRRRKAMNTLICSVDRQITFLGIMNEDVNTYVSVQNRGPLFMTYPLLTIQQRATQNNPGGASDIYLDRGTYVKSFYTVMYQPSSVKISMMGDGHRRLHHNINWECTVPCIIPEIFRKKSQNRAEVEG